MQGVQQHPRFRVSFPVGVITSSGEVEELALEDISLGGLFIRTLVPAPAGSFVRMRLAVDPERPMSLMGRVVHVIDEVAGRAKAHAPGMGVQFDGLSYATKKSLARFVDGLVAEQQTERLARDAAAAPRFVDAARVEVPSDRATLARLWAAGLERGALVVKGNARLGNRVAVIIGPLNLVAEVVAVDGGVEGGAATLRFVDLEDAKRTALARFIAGGTASIAVDGPTPDRELASVLTEARRLLMHLECKDAYGGLRLPAAATDDEVEARLVELGRMFAAPHPQASPPQRARLEAAARAVADLEVSLLPPALIIGQPIEEPDIEELGVEDVIEEIAVDERTGSGVFARQSRVTGVRARAPVDEDRPREDLAELIAEAEFLEIAGRPEEAQRALLDARELAPDHTGVTRRLTTLADTMDAAHATALLDDAERLPRELRVARVRKATHLSSSRMVLLRAMRMLANAGAMEDMLAVAELLAGLHPDDELPLFAILQVNERAHRWAAAARSGEALLRLRPDDYELHARVARLAAAAREERSKPPR